MSLKPSSALLACALAVALLGACKREEPAPTDTPQAAATPGDAADATAQDTTEPTTTIPTTQAQSGVQPAVVTIAGVEPRDFAGRFATEGTDLTLGPDGTYALSVHAASADADLKSVGTWTVEAGGNELLLDSEDKSEVDRRYAVVSKDELKSNDGGQALRRASAQ